MSLELELVRAALPNYEVGAEVGRGGWGVVLAGVHRTLGRRVAIKQLPRAFANDPVARQRFIDEARIVSSIDHPHIVPVYDFVEHGGVQLIVMELLDGGTLWDRFTSSGVRADRACVVTVAMCAALEAAHTVGVLHRDIKPENVLFNAKGVPKLSDFGIAKVLGTSARLTMVGEVVGTPAYMSPEQVLGRPLEPPSDLYSLGVVLYELLAGRLPFPDEDPRVLLNKHATAAPDPVTEVADVAGAVATIVMHALSKDPADRWPSAQEFGVRLAEAAGEAYGSGWLSDSGIPLLGGGPIVRAAHQVKDGSSRARPTVQRSTLPGHHRRVGAVVSEGAVQGMALDAGVSAAAPGGAVATLPPRPTPENRAPADVRPGAGDDSDRSRPRRPSHRARVATSVLTAIGVNGAVEEWPLVGRGGVVDRVVAALTAVPPRAVVVAGAAGVGKTRLAREVAARVSDVGHNVRTVVGTRAAATIPFAAFAGFVPAGHLDLSPLGIFGVVRGSLAGSAHRPVLLVVEDAQRLDAGSAALVHQLVAERICAVLATVRSGERAADTVAGLWKDSLAERVELGGLAREEADELVTAVLAGPVEGATLRRIWLATHGNVLFLRELVVGAVASGGLRQVDGVWRLSGDTPIPARLVELIADRLSGLEPDARAALDVIAVAERIDIDVFSALAHPAAVDELERLGFLDIQLDCEPPLVVLRHPLFGEAVRAEMTTMRRRRVCAELADAVHAAGMGDPTDLVRVATWRLEAGAAGDPDLLTAAAQRAWMTNDLALAQRLAGAAQAAGAGFDAAMVLAEVALVAGRSHDALARFDRLADEAANDEQRVRVADARAHILAAQLNREDEAIAILDDALPTIDDVDLADSLRCRLAVIHMLATRAAAALEAARPVLDRADSPSLYRATYAASIASAVCGRLDDAVRIGERGYENHRRLDEVVRSGAETQHIGPILALCAAGHLADAATMAERSYESAVAGRDAESQATFALLRGHVATQQGRTVTASQAFREALAVNREINDVVGMRWALGGVALAEGLRGERAAAVAATTELASHGRLATQILELDLVERGRGWAQVATGEFSAAAAILRAAAETAQGSGQFVTEAVLRHDLVRLGHARPEQHRLAELGRLIDGPLTATLAEHARALAEGDADTVDTVAHRLAELGCYGIALEAAADARRLLLAAGLRRRACAAEALAAKMLAACEGRSSPLAGSFAEATSPPANGRLPP